MAITPTTGSTDFSGLSGVKTAATEAAAAKAAAAADQKKGVNGALNQAQFLKLMTTQMTHQDPSKPMENGDFLAQMAQFGTVSGIQDLQKSFGEFATAMGSGQAMQAAGLVGHSVLAPATQGTLETGKPFNGEITLTDSTPNLTLKITDGKTGLEVATIPMDSQAKGQIPFTWDGSNAQGALADPGVYKVEAIALVDGKRVAMETQLQSQVQSVSMGSGANGLIVNLAGGSTVNFNQVKQII